MKVKEYKDKTTGEVVYIEEEAGNYLRVYFYDGLGEDMGDDPNPRIMNKEKFLEKFEIKDL